MLYENILKKCIEVTNLSNFNPKIGAVIFKGKRIFGTGYNDIRSSSISMKYRKWKESLHAEQAALLNLDWSKLKGCSMVILRINKQGQFRLCRPCPMCMKLLKYVGIKSIYYSNELGEIIFEKLNKD